MRGLAVAIAAAVVGVGLAACGAIFLLNGNPDDREVPDRWQRGMNLTAFLPDAYGERIARRSMLTARATGTDRVALVPTWYMETFTDSAVARDPEKTPTDESLRTAARAAAGLDLDVVIKPHVDVTDGTFRGEILPEDPEAWFSSYSAMILEYAALAAEVEADAFVVGTELTSMTLDPEPWRTLIEDVREIYEGEATFAANWVDGAESVEFWDELDYIGIDAYMPLLTPTDTPTVEELVDAWGPHKVRMKALHDRWDRPVLFTEIGYQSRIGTASRIGEDTGEVSQKAQADAYEAAFEAMTGERWFDGIWWWEWSAEGFDDVPGGFSPEDKLAEDVLVEWQGPPEAVLLPEGSPGAGP